MSTSPRTDMRRAAARTRAAVMVCALVVAGLAGGVSASFGQTPAPPATPTPPGAPAPPGTPVSPDDPEDPAGPGDEPGGGDQSTAPSAQLKPRKLDPFPVVVIAGRQARRTVRVTELTVRGPRGARVVVRCLGEGCPIRRVRNRIPASGRLRMRRAQRIYRVGTTIKIRVTGENRIGKYTKVRFRANRIPARTDACLQPGATRPSPCPD